MVSSDSVLDDISSVNITVVMSSVFCVDNIGVTEESPHLIPISPLLCS